jgi:molybdopterin converting factor small subunit
MKIVLKCFSHVKYALDTDQMEVDLGEGSTANDLEARVRSLTGTALKDVPLRVSVNQAFVEGDHVLNDGDEAALIPPVQGG